MNAIANSVRLIGNLGKEPVIKTFTNGGKIANFSLATQYNYKDKDGKKIEETDWHNIVTKGKQAELVEKYLTKGSQIALEGRLCTRKYTDASGTDKYITEIIANEIQFISGKKE